MFHGKIYTIKNTISIFIRVTRTSKAMQPTAIGTVANSLPENKVILLTLLISKRYISYTDLRKKSRSFVLLGARLPSHLSGCARLMPDANFAGACFAERPVSRVAAVRPGEIPFPERAQRHICPLFGRVMTHLSLSRSKDRSFLPRGICPA